MAQAQTWNQFYTQIAMEELYRQGVHTFFVAPGSRSSPLVLAAAAHPHIQIYTHFDERGLGFAALGYAKATSLPVAIITTSGTAVANLLPSVVEAAHSEISLVLLTADRPFELLDNGANQAIDQNHIFGSYVSQFMDIPECSVKTSGEALLSKIGAGILKCVQNKKPFHMNWHFQEPLIPLKSEVVQIPENIQNWLLSSQPWTRSSGKTEVLSSLPEVLLEKSKKGLICAGSNLTHQDQNILLKISEALKMPILFDVQNTYRFQVHTHNITNYDLILDKMSFEPDLILHFGGSLTSKRLNTFIESSQKTAAYVRIYPISDNKDFLNLQKTMVTCSYSHFLKEAQKCAPKEPSQLLLTLKSESENIEGFLKSEFKNTISEMTLPYHFLTQTKDCNLFLGSSMPIRDFERFGTTGNVRVYSNRGASGIDGNIATAFGIAAATQMPTVAYVGDLTFLYDLNSMALVSQLEHAFKVIVVNNQGGGIFSFLPPASLDSKVFQKYFHTPHSLTFEKCAEFFNMKYFKIETVADLKSALNYNGHALIELSSEASANVEEHRALTQKYKNL